MQNQQLSFYYTSVENNLKDLYLVTQMWSFIPNVMILLHKRGNKN